MRRFGAQNTACSSAASRARSLPFASARGSAFSLTVACRRGCCPHAFARSRLFGDRRADYAPSFRARGVWSLSRSGRTSEGGCSASKAASLVQLAIAWGLRLPALTAVLVGAKNPNQVQEHLGGVDLELGPDEISRIERFCSQRLRANQTSLRSGPSPICASRFLASSKTACGSGPASAAAILERRWYCWVVPTIVVWQAG